MQKYEIFFLEGHYFLDIQYFGNCDNTLWTHSMKMVYESWCINENLLYKRGKYFLNILYAQEVLTISIQ